MAVPRKIKNRATIWSSNFTSESTESTVLKMYSYTSIHNNRPYSGALLMIGKLWEQPKCPSVEKWINKMRGLVLVAVCIPTHGILFHLKKEGNSNTGYRIDEPGGYFAEWNKLVIRGQILCDPTCMTYRERLNSFRQKWLVARSCGENGTGRCLMDTEAHSSTSSGDVAEQCECTCHCRMYS